MAELKNQNPMSPNSSDPTQHVTELPSGHYSLEQQTNTAQSTAQTTASQATQALALLGHTVSYVDPAGNSGTGVVQKVDFTTSGPTLTVNGDTGIALWRQRRSYPSGTNVVSSPVQNAALVSPGLVTPTAPAAPASSATASLTGPSFAEVLAQRTDRGPAAALLAPRAGPSASARDPATQSMLDRLTNGVSRAAGKGSLDSSSSWTAPRTWCRSRTTPSSRRWDPSTCASTC